MKAFWAGVLPMGVERFAFKNLHHAGCYRDVPGDVRLQITERALAITCERSGALAASPSQWQGHSQRLV